LSINVYVNLLVTYNRVPFVTVHVNIKAKFM
jgi:hypothetical protein